MRSLNYLNPFSERIDFIKEMHDFGFGECLPVRVYYIQQVYDLLKGYMQEV